MNNNELSKKTLSVKQPWGYLICSGIKDIVVPTIKRYSDTFKKAIKVLEDENRCYVSNDAFEAIVRHFNPHLHEVLDKYKVF